MLVSIHQPNYIPWIPYFQKIKNSDIFVLLDDVKYTKNDWRNRNRILINNEPKYLTIPILKENYSNKINEVFLPKDNSWKKKHLDSILFNYSTSPHVDDYREFLVDYFTIREKSLCDFLNSFLTFSLDMLKISTKIIRSSSLDINPELKSTERLISIVEKVGGKSYLSGSGGKNYLSFELFKNKSIDIIFQKPEFREYNQNSNSFVPGLSIIDLFLNVHKDDINEYV